MKSLSTLESNLQGSPALGRLSALAGDSGNSARLACSAAAIKTTTEVFAILSATGLSLASSDASATECQVD